MSLSYPYPQGSRIYSDEEAEMVGDSEETAFSKHNRVDAHKLTETVTGCTDLHKFKSYQISAWRI